MDMPLRSPLHDRHVDLGALFGTFADWDMPLSYKEGGVLAEHAAVRDRVGVFDVSHLGKIRISGEGAVSFLNQCFTNDLAKLTPGQAQYTLCCDETGGVIDDMIVYQRSDDEVLCIPNAANAADVAKRLSGDSEAESLVISNEHHAYAVIAVQGPDSAELLSTVNLPSGFPYMSFMDVSWGGSRVTVCRTGYTGEHGYELVVPVQAAVALWDALLTPSHVQPCGLGARDTLRTEMGYPLHGQDISRDITPVQARMNWAVGWDKPTFWGKGALYVEKRQGPTRQLWGLASAGRAIPRPGMALFATAESGQPHGVVTSGTFSPTRKEGIGLALLDTKTDLGEGDTVYVQVRARRLPMTLVRPPFVDSRPV